MVLRKGSCHILTNMKRTIMKRQIQNKNQRSHRISLVFTLYCIQYWCFNGLVSDAVYQHTDTETAFPLNEPTLFSRYKKVLYLQTEQSPPKED